MGTAVVFGAGFTTVFVVVVLFVAAGVVFTVLGLVTVVVVVVVVFLTALGIAHLQVGDAEPSLHIWNPVVLLHEATPPCPAQHAA